MARTQNTLLTPDFIAKLDQLELVSRKIISGRLKGERRSKRRGHSTEFADYRPYVAGDDLRFLDWNIFGRLDRLFLKLFEEEEELWVNILIDQSRSMDFGDPNKFDYARRLAAALGYIGLINHDRVRVCSFSDKLDVVFSPSRGKRQVWKLIDSIERMEVGDAGGTDMDRACRDFAVTNRLSGIVILVSDFFDRNGFESALRYFLARSNQTEVYVFHVLAPEEIDPKISGDLRLIDAEDGVAAEVSVSRLLLKRYQRNLDAFRAEIQTYCSRRGMQYLFNSTEYPFDQLVLGYLRRRGLVK